MVHLREGESMAQQIKQRLNLQAQPVLQHEPLYVGIDIGKTRHLAGFVSTTFLERYQRFEACPALAFANSREGFWELVERMKSYAPLEHCTVLMEKTGHYHRTLLQYLQDLDLPVYLIHIQVRPAGMMKTDKRDALGLANHLYNQLELGAQREEKALLARRVVPPSPAAAQLKGLIRHRYELVHEATQRKNKLIAICDELFPEITKVFKDPNLPTALVIREHFPTPQILAVARLSELQEARGKSRILSDARLLELQRLATSSIGIKDPIRQRSLILEQKQLIQELQLLQSHLHQLEDEIKTIVDQERESQILSSMGLGPIQVATIIAAIGSILNFPNAGCLKSYFGWAPVREQTGTSYDRSTLMHGGTRTMRQMMFLIVLGATQRETEWAKLYTRLVQKNCPYDERTGERKGKKRVIGRIAGQMIETMYALLKTDAEIVSSVRPGEVPPPPILYDANLHRKHREGQYKSTKPSLPPNIIMLQPDRQQ